MQFFGVDYIDSWALFSRTLPAILVGIKFTRSRFKATKLIKRRGDQARAVIIISSQESPKTTIRSNDLRAKKNHHGSFISWTCMNLHESQGYVRILYVDVVSDINSSL